MVRLKVLFLLTLLNNCVLSFGYILVYSFTFIRNFASAKSENKFNWLFFMQFKYCRNIIKIVLADVYIVLFAVLNRWLKLIGYNCLILLSKHLLRIISSLLYKFKLILSVSTLLLFGKLDSTY